MEGFFGAVGSDGQVALADLVAMGRANGRCRSTWTDRGRAEDDLRNRV